MSDTPYGKIITSLANLAKLPDYENRINRSDAMDEVVRIRASADLLKRENADLRAKLEAAQRDAERYRWLKEGKSTEFSIEFRLLESLYGDAADARIDAAMQEGK